MVKVQIFSLLALVFGSTAIRAESKQELPKEQQLAWVRESFVAFSEWAYADQQGKRLISLSGDMNGPLQKVEILKKFMGQVTQAVCGSGLVTLENRQYQVAKPAFNHRDNVTQFDNRPGFVFNIQGSPIKDELCLLVSPQIAKQIKIHALETTVISQTASDKLLKKIASKVGRPVENAIALRKIETGTLWLVNFKRQGNSKRAGFFLEPTASWFDGFNSACEPKYCLGYRVDGEENLAEYDFRVTTHLNWKGRDYLFMTWPGTEGEAILGFALEGDRMIRLNAVDNEREDTLGYRYMAPL